MSRIRNCSARNVAWRLLSAPLVVLLILACSQEPAHTSSAAGATVKKVPAGQENSGFLKDYSKLAPHPSIEGAQTYVHPDKLKGLTRYVAMIVDPVEVYVVSDADPSSISEEGLEQFQE